MATGYTDIIKDGVSFRDFTLRCSRAFGALIEMRDEPLSAPIQKEFKPSDYYINSIKDAESELKKLRSMTLDEAGRQRNKENERLVSEGIKANEQRVALKVKYDAMLTQVKAWQPPTKEHQGLKDFMISQINDSVKHDCSDTSEYYKPTLKTAEEWLADKIESAEKNLVYHKRKHEEEIQSCKERTDWVNQLINSLK